MAGRRKIGAGFLIVSLLGGGGSASPPPPLSPTGGGAYLVASPSNPWDAAGYWHNRVLDSLMKAESVFGAPRDSFEGPGKRHLILCNEQESVEEYMLEVQERLLEWMLDSALSYEEVYERLLYWEEWDRRREGYCLPEQAQRKGASFSVLRYSLYYWWLVHQPKGERRRKRRTVSVILLVLADVRAMVWSGCPYQAARESARAYEQLLYALPERRTGKSRKERS